MLLKVDLQAIESWGALSAHVFLFMATFLLNKQWQSEFKRGGIDLCTLLYDTKIITFIQHGVSE